MAAVAGKALAGGIGHRTGPPIGLSARRLVLSAEIDPASTAMVLDAALGFAPDRRPALVVLEVRRFTLIVAPHAGPSETRVVVVGELDLATLPMFVGSLTLALHHRPSLVVLDFRRLSFIDARSAGAIAWSSTRMREWDGTLAVHRPQRTVRRVLGLCGLADLLVPHRVLTDATPVPAPQESSA